MGRLVETSAASSLSPDCNGSVIVDRLRIAIYVLPCHSEIDCWSPRWRRVICLLDNDTNEMGCAQTILILV